MVKRKPEDIISLVDDFDTKAHHLRERFEDDYELYTLAPYDAGEDYQSYTSNAPQTLADKVISWVSSSNLVVRCKHKSSQHRHERENDTAKERFIDGNLRAVDERLLKLLLPTLREQLAFFAVVRGWICGRAMLVKRKDGSTYADVMPFDPLHISWAMGKDGLEWACYKIKKTKQEIEAEYKVKVPGDYTDTDGCDVYDFYDKEHNQVVMADKVLKKATVHGSPDSVPWFLTVVGSAPPIQRDHGFSATTDDETLTHYGESIFKADRNLYDSNNMMMSILLELVSRSRKPPVIVKSRDGSKTLDEDPYKTGVELSLAEGDDVKALQLVEASRDLGGLAGLVSGEMQRGGLPHSVFGDIQFQLSGYAISTLRQGIDTVLQPRVYAVRNAYKQIGNLLVDQYITGSYPAMSLSGKVGNREYFDEEITPDIVKEACDMTYELLPSLPQDDMTKYSMAQIAREGEVPLLPDINIRADILKLEDPDDIEDAIKEQMGERMLPEATLWLLMQAMVNRGRPDLASMYFVKLQELYQQKDAAAQQAQMQQMATMAGAGGPPGGLPPMARDPRVQPQAAMGGAPSPLLSNPGPQRPPGAPRPGAQGDDTRLAGLGLFGPGG